MRETHDWLKYAAEYTYLLLPGIYIDIYIHTFRPSSFFMASFAPPSRSSSMLVGSIDISPADLDRQTQMQPYRSTEEGERTKGTKKKRIKEDEKKGTKKNKL